MFGKYVAPGELIHAPAKFNLTRGAAVDVGKFLRAVSHTVLTLKIPVKLDFKRTSSFFVPGAILLLAEVDRIVSLSNLRKPITIIDPIARRAREVMKQIGIHRLTGDSSDVVPTRQDVVFWKATKGATQSGEQLGPLLEHVTERANEEHAKQVEVSGIWRGVSEAVANAVEHAYAIPRRDGFAGLTDTKWWMFTQIREGRFTAAVCDLGCGYQATTRRNLPEKILAMYAQTLQGQNPDALAIQTAMEYGRSATSQSHRGKGSRDALSVLAKHGRGELFVLSNSGWVRYEVFQGQERITSEGIGIDVKSTIIWWNLPLEESANADS